MQRKLSTAAFVLLTLLMAAVILVWTLVIAKGKKGWEEKEEEKEKSSIVSLNARATRLPSMPGHLPPTMGSGLNDGDIDVWFWNTMSPLFPSLAPLAIPGGSSSGSSSGHFCLKLSSYMQFEYVN